KMASGGTDCISMMYHVQPRFAAVSFAHTIGSDSSDACPNCGICARSASGRSSKTHLRETDRHLTPTVRSHAPICLLRREQGRELYDFSIQRLSRQAQSAVDAKLFRCSGSYRLR